MKAVCVVAENEVNPFWGIVIFDEGTMTAQEAIEKDFKDNTSIPPGDDYGEWFANILGDYDYFYIPLVVGQRFKGIEFPTIERALEIGLADEGEIASMCMETLMVSVLRTFRIAIEITIGSTKVERR